MWNLIRNDTTELIYKTETDSQTQIKNYGYQGRRVRESGNQGVWD